MEIPARKRRLPRENVVPLINVVFLLLIFFMLAGTLRPPDPLAIEPPESPLSAAETRGASRVSLGSGGEIAVDGLPVDLSELSGVVSSLTAEGAAARWILRADAQAAASELIPVLSALREGGLDRIELAVLPPVEH